MQSYYQNLDVWKKAIDFIEQIYLFTAKFPKEEIYGITSQMRRAAVSIASNIAEGSGKKLPQISQDFSICQKDLLWKLKHRLLSVRDCDIFPQQMKRNYFPRTLLF